jgi:hypothetical protein
MKPLCFELTMCESNAADDCVNQYAEGVGEPIRRRRWRTNTPKALANQYAEGVGEPIRRRRSLIAAQGWSASDNPG